MFGLAAGFYHSYLGPPNLSVLLVGLDGAGKTTLMERVKVTDFSNPRSKGRSRFSCGNHHRGGGDEEELMVVRNRREKTRHDHSFLLERTTSQAGVDGIHRAGGIVPLVAHSSKPIDPSVTEKEKETYEEEYDLKNGAKMLPLRLIRPTVGMNLAKIEAFHAKIKLMDLSGRDKMRPLWERYYPDMDAILFVVDLTSSIVKLMEARAAFRCMRDDEALNGIPIVIFGNRINDFAPVNGNFKHGNHMHTTERKTEENGRSAPAEPQQQQQQHVGHMSLEEIAELFVTTPASAYVFSEDEEETYSSKDVSHNVSVGEQDEPRQKFGNGNEACGLWNDETALHPPQIVTTHFSLTPSSSPLLAQTHHDMNHALRQQQQQQQQQEEEEEDLVVLVTGSAKTGRGVRTALEWLILKAKLVQKQRQQQRVAQKEAAMNSDS